MTIVSFHNKYIFIKTRKTAGTSIQTSLLPYCGEGDIVTRVWTNVLTSKKSAVEEFATLEEVENAYSINRQDYFTFGFTRNPYSLVHSRYLYQIRLQRIPGPATKDNFNWWIKNVYFKGEIGFPKGRYIKDRTRYLLFDKNFKQKVDFIGKVEKLKHDFSYITNKTCLPGNIQLEHVNKSNVNNAHYREWLDGESIKLIKSKFGFELKNFNYGY